MSSPTPSSIVVVSYNTRTETVACIESLVSDAPEGTEIFLVDNASMDGTAESVAERFPEIRLVVLDTNLGFAKACNIGTRASSRPYLAFINSDCLAQPGCLPRLTSYLDEHPEVSAVAPRLVGDEGETQINATRLPSALSLGTEYLVGRMTGRYDLGSVTTPMEVESVSGAALVIRRDDFWAAGGFHEEYFMYVEDVELSRRLGELGKPIHYVPDAVMYHAEGGSSEGARGELDDMLHRHREDYVRRTMPPRRAVPTIAAMRAGRRITPLRDALLAQARQRRR